MNIYFASKLTYADIGRQIRLRWAADGLCITSGWLDQVEQEALATKEQFTFHWLRDFYDIRKSDGLLLYIPQRSDEPRGALIEAGAMLAKGGFVLPVGCDHPALGTWQHHPLVLPRVCTIEEAYNNLKYLSL